MKNKNIQKAKLPGLSHHKLSDSVYLVWIYATRFGPDMWAWCVMFHLAMDLCYVHLSGVDYLLIRNGEFRNRLEQPRAVKWMQ